MHELPVLGGTPVTGLKLLAAELAITVSNPEVWLSIGLALLLGAICLTVGISVARTVGLLQADAPAGETLGVGLASGLMVLAAWWAAVWSGGRSSFTPVAVGFAVALGLALARRFRRGGVHAHVDGLKDDDVSATRSRTLSRSTLRVAALAGGVFILAVALLYGSTMAPSARDGMQPLEFRDEAFYAILGRDLTTTGTETNLSASEFSDLPDVPAQTWYHWGELWLASAVITIFGTAPMAARYLIVLPILLLAAAALTGTIVRRFAQTQSRGAYLFGFLACLFLAPVPLPGTFFSAWAAGLMFGINLYGLSAVATLLALYAMASFSSRNSATPLAAFVGSATALILPAHIVIAAVALVGFASVWMLRVAQTIRTTHGLPVSSPIWKNSVMMAAALLIATAVWGSYTGHGLGGSVSASVVSPFNLAWQRSVAFIFLGAGGLLAIPIGAVFLRHEAPGVARLCFGAAMLLIAGAIAWGARLADFSMFHVFFGGLVVIGTPVAAVAAWTLFARLRELHWRRLALVMAFFGLVQLGIGVGSSTVRLQEFGPRLHEQAMPVALLEAITRLPPTAKLAYACRPLEEISWTDPSLVSIDAHTGRRVIPMCFEADVFSTLNGARESEHVPAAGFASAPQFALYPDAAARPSSASVAAFLKAHGIDYIYVDAQHSQSLVDGAVPIAVSGDARVLRVP